MLLAYVRGYVSTWRSLPTVHPLSRCCFRDVLHRGNGVHGVYTRLEWSAWQPRVFPLFLLFPLLILLLGYPFPPLAPPGLPSSVPLPPRPYRVACRAGERIRSRLHYLLLNNRRLDSPSILPSSYLRPPSGVPQSAYRSSAKDRSLLSVISGVPGSPADPIIRKDISKHVILLGHLRITRGSLPMRLFRMRGRGREVSRIRWNLRGTDAPAFPLIQCVWFVLRGGSWVLNASQSGAGVSNALPYYLLLIGSAFVELLRLRAARFHDRYDWLSSLQPIILC